MPPERLLSRVDVGNFKSIKHASLDLRPLTVFVGENSAGKSSVLQAILLLAQICRGHARPDTVALNGPDLKLGNFSDVIHGGGAMESIELALAVPSKGHVIRRAYVDAQSGGRRTTPETNDVGASWHLTLSNPSGELGVARVTGVGIHNDLDLVRLQVSPNEHRNEIAELYERSRSLGFWRRIPRGRGRFVGEADSVALFKGELDTEADGERRADSESLPAVAVENGFPVELYAYESELLVLAKQWVQTALRESGMELIPRMSRFRRMEQIDSLSDLDHADALQVAETLFPEFRRWVDSRDRGTQPELPNWDEMLAAQVFVLGDAVPRLLGGLLEGTREDRGAIIPHASPVLSIAASLSFVLNNSLHYLGPLREDPSPTYAPAQEGGVATLGRKGESTVALLHTYRTQLVECPIEGETKQLPLWRAVEYWMNRLGFASGIGTQDLGKAGVGLELTDIQTGEGRDLTSVGVGASQLLPVIVVCLFAQPGELVLIEQPELHLHPAPQQVLGDFLLDIAESGRQLIVETHSEYLINRLRRRVAEDKFGATEDLVRIWYTTRADGRTQFKAMEPDKFGSFHEWPEGFFDQASAESEAILRAVASKRRSAD